MRLSSHLAWLTSKLRGGYLLPSGICGIVCLVHEVGCVHVRLGGNGIYPCRCSRTNGNLNS
jgi:hypothetical protein